MQSHPMSEENNCVNDSIFGMISAALDPQGHLPQDFELPWQGEEGEVRYAPGAMDGITLFHTQIEYDQAEVEELVTLFKRACDSLDSEGVSSLCDYIAGRSVLSLSDPLLDRIFEENSGIDPESIYRVAWTLMTETSQQEGVKLGIVLMRLLDLSEDAETRDAILTLGKYDEFTLYSLVAADSWDDFNAQVFLLAKETHGWGKIHAMHYLEVDTEEIRDWVITDGCHNEIMNEYLALLCAEKGDLLSYLERETLTDALFNGAEKIMEALLSEGPAEGISAYESAESAVARYLFHAQKSERLRTHKVVHSVKVWLTESEFADKEVLIAECNAFLNRPHWVKTMWELLNSGDKHAIWEATLFALAMEVDISERLFEIIKSDPIEYSGYSATVCASPKLATQLFDFYEQTLPLSDIAMGHEELFAEYACLSDVLQELRAFPGYGLRLIETGLASWDEHNRYTALGVLEAWHEQGTLLADAAPELVEQLILMRKEEEDEELQALLDTLLG